MLDKELIVMFRQRLVDGITAAQWTMPVVAKNQPTMQGIETQPTVFFEKLWDQHYGWAKADLNYNPTTVDYSETETQQVATVFRVSALAIQDPADLNSPTAADVTNYLAQWIKSRATVKAFMAQNVNLQRVTEVHNPVWVDDRDRFEQMPLFDVTLTHQRTLTTTVPSTKIIVGKLIPTFPTHQGTFPVLGA